MNSITIQIDTLTERFMIVSDEFPKKQKELHQRLGAKLKNTVDHNIGGSGKVQSWQSMYIGSKGGYAAVRPRDGNVGKYRIGHITNAIENGHAIRKPSLSAKKYYPKIHKTRVEGKKFYEQAGRMASSELEDAAEQFANEMAKELNRGL